MCRPLRSAPVELVAHAAVTVPIDSLRAHPRNYRAHPDEQLDHIARSIELHGIYRSIVTARDHTILAGHGVWLAARRLGLEVAPIVRLELDPDEPRAMQLLAGDNEMSNLAEIDDRALTEILRELAGDDIDLLLSTGFNAEQVAALALTTRTRAELDDFDAAAEWLGLPEFEPIGPEGCRLSILFDSREDRERFVATHELQVTRFDSSRQAWSMRWPPRSREDTGSLLYQ